MTCTLLSSIVLWVFVALLAVGHGEPAATCSSPDCLIATGGAEQMPSFLMLMQTNLQVKPPRENRSSTSLESARLQPSSVNQSNAEEKRGLEAASQLNIEITHKRNHTDMTMAKNGSEASDSTIWDGIAREIGYELEAPEGGRVRSKVVLYFLEVFGLGILGLDRCYMGQTWIGILKCVTGGGFMVWAILDYIVIVVNALGRYPDIDCIGYRATFEPRGVDRVFWITLILLLIAFLVPAFRKSQMDAKKDGVPT